ncbi:hypothetical protein PUNSTDRAFT_117269 [Punctularia strigosozonata HHB-11173 SS5]|uniref:uncharacterized protein n=1 Tax=Punctularia strigosozonata (strain HHB-11173) TaxID=741275 RepID=UPI0004416B39|nr:uncharacterized protein PUNSTDRAFT_117269 [Punctularia strigosozonata HHB-11173 SS5]EIN13519.1 hypothetical protein PUNSTDRAFT_117269 [Punctularia strigosozonata HHB-11173 SS5]
MSSDGRVTHDLRGTSRAPSIFPGERWSILTIRIIRVKLVRIRGLSGTLGGIVRLPPSHALANVQDAASSTGSRSRAASRVSSSMYPGPSLVHQPVPGSTG